MLVEEFDGLLTESLLACRSFFPFGVSVSADPFDSESLRKLSLIDSLALLGFEDVSDFEVDVDFGTSKSDDFSSLTSTLESGDDMLSSVINLFSFSSENSGGSSNSTLAVKLACGGVLSCCGDEQKSDEKKPDEKKPETKKHNLQGYPCHTSHPNGPILFDWQFLSPSTPKIFQQ